MGFKIVNEFNKEKRYSDVCEVDGKKFRFDYANCVIEYVTELDDFWKELGEKDEEGYVVLDAIGLRSENWDNEDTRRAYLDDYCYQIDEETACMMAMERF